MSEFAYTPENLAELERTLSSERLSPYLTGARGELRTAIRLYEQNILLSESLYGLLQGLEIALRNRMHAELTAGLGLASWWDAKALGVEQARMLQNAQSSLTRGGKALDPGRVVAELSFGFWTGLFGPKYTDLWKDYLVKVFPRRSLQRAEVQVRLNSIRKLRNRVAHHEIILNRPLQRDANQILDALSWMSPVSARWVRTNSSFEERYRTYRSLFPVVSAGRP